MDGFSYFIIIAVSVLAIIFILYLHLKRWLRKIKVNLEKANGIEKLIELLFLFDQKKVYLNITLTKELSDEFKNVSSLKLPLVFRSNNLSGGIRVVFDTGKDYRIFNKIFIEPNKINGYFKILHQPGPELGWFTIIMQPVL